MTTKLGISGNSGWIGGSNAETSERSRSLAKDCIGGTEERTDMALDRPRYSIAAAAVECVVESRQVFAAVGY
jgi:hypothetical protein